MGSQSGKGVKDILNIWGGVGRLVFADAAEPYPTTLSDILNPSTGVLASGWNDFGATDGGVRMEIGFEKQEWEVDQETAPIDEFITRWNYKLTSTLIENSLENLKLIWEGTSITTNATPTPDERKVSFGTPTSVTQRMLAYIQDKREVTAGDGRIRAYIFRKARFDGSNSSHEFTKGQKAKIPVTFSLFPDTTLSDDQNMMYILDQVQS